MNHAIIGEMESQEAFCGMSPSRGRLNIGEREKGLYRHWAGFGGSADLVLLVHAGPSHGLRDVKGLLTSSAQT